jgi:hypothetical protein
MTSALALHLKDPRELYQGPLDPDFSSPGARTSQLTAPVQRITVLLLCVTISMAALATADSAARTPAPPHRPQ